MIKREMERVQIITVKEKTMVAIGSQAVFERCFSAE